MHAQLYTHRPRSEPNVTPMIDVMLVLLIMFMLVVPMARRAIDVHLPVPTRGDTSAVPIVLEVAPRGMYVINRDPVPAGRLAERLRAIYDGRPEKIMFVKGDGRARYQEVIAAMDVARGAGVRVLALAPRE